MAKSAFPPTETRGGSRAAGARPSTATGKATAPLQGKVNVNTASFEELQRLPRVGPVTARRIIEYRQANGPFRSVEELLEVKGIGPKSLETLRPLVEL
ncbi:MAG: helix-hairpin-helix domain-containing protein [Armatimonadota bacterium]|nr:helix-hairpin-helix domain-containing protein [Armatimonadota bacterium]